MIKGLVNEEWAAVLREFADIVDKDGYGLYEVDEEDVDAMRIGADAIMIEGNFTPFGDRVFFDVCRDIQRERSKQDQQWGGPAHDDQHASLGWKRIISEHADRLVKAPYMTAADDYRQRLVKIAAVAVAAIQAYDRKEGAER